MWDILTNRQGKIQSCSTTQTGRQPYQERSPYKKLNLKNEKEIFKTKDDLKTARDKQFKAN